MFKIFNRKKYSGLKYDSFGEIFPEEILLDATNIPNFNMQQLEGFLVHKLNKALALSMGVLFFFILSLFIYKMYAMQIVDGDKYNQLAERNKFRVAHIFARRGAIIDRNGTLLAWNTASTTSSVIKREYIDKEGFSTLLGYVSYPRLDKSGVFWQSEYIGKDGIEKQYQTKLNGTLGTEIYEVRATGEVLPGKITSNSIEGEAVILNIDANLQNKMFKYIKELAIDKGFNGGAGVMMNVNTGKVVAITSYPEYNNNIMSNATSSEDKSLISEWLIGKDNKFTNRAISGLYTPGSTVKPFMAYSALVEGIIDPYKNILSTGKLVIKNKYGGPDTVFKDWKAHGYVDMRHGIAVSSDEYFYQIGGGYGDQKGLGIDNIYKYMSQFGFGSDTGIDLPNEHHGIIPNREWKQKMYKDGDWKLGDTYHTSIGQYGFQTSPIELLRSVSAIANGGTLVTPHVYSEIHTDNNFKKNINNSSLNKESINLNLDQSKLKVVQEGMRLAVTDQNIGTVKSLYVKGIDVAAKSGTAELGVKKDRVNSWVMGYFPYEKPEYAFVVIMESGDVKNLTGASSVMRKVLQYLVENPIP